MDATFDGDLVRAGRQAREQFYDARGYGRPDDGGVVLDPVEAAHLLYRGDLDAVVDGRSEDRDRLDFRAFLASTAVSEVAFFVYKDLRDRGFYLSPTREDWVDVATGDFVVYPRGQGPWDDAVAYRVRAVSERADVSAEMLETLATAGDSEDAGGEDAGSDATESSKTASDDEGTGVLAVVDEESELTYLEVTSPAITGSTHHDISAVTGDLLSDRVLVWEPSSNLHDRAFYGQRLDDNGGAVQLSLVEGAYLASQGTLSLASDDATDGVDDEQAVVDRGRAVEGERFDRRLRVYSALRTAGVVPKTAFKFGADFRTYADVESVDNLGHSELLVRVLSPTHAFAPRDLALDVRLAHGVRKRMVFALTGANEGIDWLSVSRLTP
ncbi:tRNA-intron lyase [Salinibaculum rarum]|uniref:tRNA-intron lyase n=1 Tax=Salinibaculum rarum TaxID=3058903 RepID=UPI00265F02E9|nr:tRNA-intron lyase [Salinibaculum sp. KK48]